MTFSSSFTWSGVSRDGDWRHRSLLCPGPVVAAGDSPWHSLCCKEHSFVLLHVHKPLSVTGTMVATGLHNVSRVLARP